MLLLWCLIMNILCACFHYLKKGWGCVPLCGVKFVQNILNTGWSQCMCHSSVGCLSWFYTCDISLHYFNLSVFVMSTVLVIVPNVFPVLSMWFQYLQLLFLVLMSCMCSLYLILNGISVLCILMDSLAFHFVNTTNFMEMKASWEADSSKVTSFPNVL